MTDGKMAKTLESYTGDVRGFLQWLEERKDCPEEEFSRKDVVEYRNHLLDAGYAVATVNKKVNSLRSFNRYLVRKGMMDEMVVKPDKDRVKVAKGSGDSINTFSQAELFDLERSNRENAKIFCLLEHKSSPERGTALQVLRYMTRIYSEHYRNGEIPLVLPIVFYHGSEEWNAPWGISDLIPGDMDWAGKAVPEFGYYLYRLEDVVDSLPEMTMLRLRLYIRALRVSRAETEEEFFVRLREYARELRNISGEENWRWRGFAKPTFIYILETSEAEQKEIVEVVRKEVPGRSDELVTVADSLRKEELVNTLVKQLEKKLAKSLPKNVKEQMNASDREILVEIRDNIFEIEDLEEVKEILGM